jgi:hypothetical protein
MSEDLILKQKSLNMITNLMTYLTHCHGPSQPYGIIYEHVDCHYELSPSNSFLPPLLSTWRYVLCCSCCWCFHRTSNSRRSADHIKPRKLHIADKAAELVGHLAKVDKAVNIIYTLQYLTSQARFTAPYQLSSNLTSSSIRMFYE